MAPPRKMSFCQIFNPRPYHRDRQAPLEVFAHFKLIASSVPLRQSVPPTLLLRHSVSPNSPDNGEVLHFCYGFNHFVTVFPHTTKLVFVFLAPPLYCFFYHYYSLSFFARVYFYLQLSRDMVPVEVATLK